MRRALTISLFFLLLFLAGCAPVISVGPTLQLEGSGKPVTQSFSFDKADRLLAASNYQVTLTKGDKVQVTVTADDNVMKYVYVHVSDGELRLEMQPGRVYSMNKVTLEAEVAMPVPDAITLQDNATLKSDGMQAADLSVRLSGNAILTGDGVSIPRLSLTSIGNGIARLGGAAAELTLDARGNAQAVCPGLQAHTADVTLRENAMAALQVTDKLSYNVSGNASLVYSGTPQLGEQKRSGNATVQQK